MKDGRRCRHLRHAATCPSRLAWRRSRSGERSALDDGFFQADVALLDDVELLAQVAISWYSMPSCTIFT